jgi:hypothetical protein
MDLVTSLTPTARGHDAVVVFVDRLSKMVHFAPTSQNVTSEGLADLFLWNVFRLHGMPDNIVSDRDVRFMSAFWSDFFARAGTRLAMTSVYHPQADGQTERMNRVLEEMLRAYVGHMHRDWDRYLAQVEFAYNDAVHVGTGFSPFYLNAGQHPRSPVAVAVGASPGAAGDVFANIEKAVALAKQHISRAQLVYAGNANRGSRGSAYVEGDLVMVKAANFHLPEHPNDKFKPKYIGPFRVARRVQPDTYALHLPGHMRGHNRIHASMLLPFRQRGDWFFPAVETPGAVVVDGVDEHRVERILDKRTRRYGRGSRVEYLVRFEGELDDTHWLPASALTNAPDRVAEFEATL